MGNERGHGPATSVSPVYLASTKREAREDRRPHPIHPIHPGLTWAAAEVTGADCRRSDRPFIEPDEGADGEIEKVFRRTIASLRRLPRRERPAAVQAAKDTRMLALKALREKRAYRRHAEYMLRKLKAEPGSR